MRVWHLGNTTVRSPFRLREGLVALSTSPLQGNLRGEENEKALRQLLGEHGIVELGEDSTYSVGRKWRSALGKLGFLFPEIPAATNIPQEEIGALDTITMNGWRLIRADTVPAMQECFLRSLAAYYIPSAIEQKGYNFPMFSPLRHTLAILLELEKQRGDSRLNFIEMALIVQVSTAQDSIETIVASIIDLRRRRESAPNKQLFDGREYKAAGTRYSYKPATFKDYADTNFRYLKATGLVQSKGKGIALVPEKRVFIEQLVQDAALPASNLSYFSTLCNGAILPTDNAESAKFVLDDLVRQANERGIPFDIGTRPVADAADIAIVRHEIEALLSEQKEEEYAHNQAAVWQEIALYMRLLIERRSSINTPQGETIEIPKLEAPAYFEWVLWRAFLAINSLVNPPYKSRRFKIDQDFLPVGTAPGGGADLIMEFADFLVVVEVTLTENSRQEAAEGEPVRRHVADMVMQYQKPVYGLFIANRIDSNTAETFRIGVWYGRDDQRMSLNIIPLTLEQFKTFFEAIFTSGRVEVQLIQKLLDDCGNLRASHEAPIWKQQIQATVLQHSTQLTHSP